MGKKAQKMKSVTKSKTKAHKQKVKSHKKNKISKPKYRTKQRSESQDKYKKPEAPLTDYLAHKSNYIAVRFIFECGMVLNFIIYVHILEYAVFYLCFMNRY